MPIVFDTQLMPQTLPGRAVRHRCSRVEMVAADSHRVVAFVLDDQRQLTVWCSSQEGFVRWAPLPAVPGTEGPVKVIDFDVIGNVGEGRQDGTLDLAMLVYRDDGRRQIYYWPRVPADASPEAWRLLFAGAQPLAVPHRHPLEVLRLGRLPRPVRHLITGSYQTSQWWEMWRVGTDASGCVCTALDPLPAPRMNGGGGPSSYLLAAAVAQRVDDPALEDGVLVATRHDRQEVFTVDLLLPAAPGRLAAQWPVRALDDRLTWPGCLSDLQTVFDPASGQASFVFTMAGDACLNQVVTLFQVLSHWRGDHLPLSVPGLVPAEGPVRVVPLDGTGQRVGRFERMRPPGAARGTPALLVWTTSNALLDTQVASVPLFENVVACCACRCGDGRIEPTALHVLVAYADGGLALFTQDSVSGQWQRFALTDDDVREGMHTVYSYSTRIRVEDARGTALPGLPVRLRAQTPCQALLNGNVVHMTPLLEETVTTDGTGAVNLVQPVSALGAALIDVRAGDATPAVPQTLNPMDKAMARLGAIRSGADLRAVRASDGSMPFAHLPQDRCDEAASALARVWPAYQATLEPRANGAASQQVTARTQLIWRGARVSVEHAVLPTPADRPADGWWAPVGDILGYLWTLAKDTVTEVVTELQWLADGLADLVVTIGETVWRATLVIASQAAELIDWVLQKSLGIGLEDLVNWLGQVFDWPAIQRAQQALRHLTILGGQHVTGWLRNEAPKALDGLLVALQGWLATPPPQDDASRRLSARPASAGIAGAAPLAPHTLGPDMLWGQTQLLQFADEAGGQPPVPPQVQALLDAVREAGQALQTDAARIADWARSQDVENTNAARWSADLSGLLGQAALDPLLTFIRAVLPTMATALDDLVQQADSPLDIPVLGPLYRSVIHPGHDLTLLDASALIAATAGHIGSEAFLGEPLITPALAERILAATSFA